MGRCVAPADVDLSEVAGGRTDFDGLVVEREGDFAEKEVAASAFVISSPGTTGREAFIRQGFEAKRSDGFPLEFVR